MRAMALLMITTILLVPLAGCVDSGDGPQFELSAEDIEQLIDDNMEDFLNNSSITMINNNYDNTTINPPSSLHSSSGISSGVSSSVQGFNGGALLVRNDAFSSDSMSDAYEIDGANICVGVGTILEKELQDYFGIYGTSFTSIGIADEAESTDKLIAGECDAAVFPSFSSALYKQNSLDSDGSIAGGTWIAELSHFSSEGTTGVSNSLSVIIEQDGDEMLTGFKYIFGQVTLNATCNDNATDCNSFEVQFTTSEDGGEWGNFWPAIGGSMHTSCSGNVEFTWGTINLNQVMENLDVYNEFYFFLGTGLDCIHEFIFNINQDMLIMLQQEFNLDLEKHTLSWSDWTYSLVWESIPIES
ncbi:MAG: hypothetical protein ACJZ46_04925 [Candidatus Thalassarchaeaceae archaeon]